jgi:glutathione S-transferase
MLKFYFNGSPNPTKVALFLEEAGLPYEAVPVDTRKGDQFKPAFLAVNPNGKVPAIVDGEVAVFDSNAILLYLAEKTGKFLPPATQRGELLSWLMFVATGVGPFSGQAVHFRHHAPEKPPYAQSRYQYEAERHYGILNARLAKSRYMVGGAVGEIPQRQAAGRRGERAPSGGPRGRPQGQAHLQGRDGRRGARPHVQASQEGELAVMPEFRACPRACPVGQRNIRYPVIKYESVALGPGSRADALGRHDNAARARSPAPASLMPAGTARGARPESGR